MIMKKAFISFLFFLTINPSILLAQKITAEMVEVQTLENNPSIKEAKNDLYMKHQALYASFSLFLPNISLIGTLATKDGGYYNIINKLGDAVYRYGVSTNFSLFSGGSDYNKVRSLLAEAKKAQEAYRRAVCDAVLGAQNAYVNLIYTYELIRLYESIKQRETENCNIVKIRYLSGSVDLGSLRRVEADLKLTEWNLEKALREIQIASVDLLVTMGKDPDMAILETDERIEVDGVKAGDDFNEKPDLDKLIAEIPEFLVKKYELAYVKALSWARKGELLPKVDLSWSIHRQRYDKNWNPENKSWEAMLNLSYPLFTGGKRLFDIKSYCAQEKKIAEEFRRIQSVLKAQALRLYIDKVNICELNIANKYYLESCKLQADIAKRKYMNGIISYEDWYSIEAAYTRAQKDMLSYMKKKVTMEIEWRKFLGKASMKDKKEDK
jgi:outer membrane protein TolC